MRGGEYESNTKVKEMIAAALAYIGTFAIFYSNYAMSAPVSIATHASDEALPTCGCAWDTSLPATMVSFTSSSSSFSLSRVSTESSSHHYSSNPYYPPIQMTKPITWSASNTDTSPGMHSTSEPKPLSSGSLGKTSTTYSAPQSSRYTLTATYSSVTWKTGSTYSTSAGSYTFVTLSSTRGNNGSHTPSATSRYSSESKYSTSPVMSGITTTQIISSPSHYPPTPNSSSISSRSNTTHISRPTSNRSSESNYSTPSSMRSTNTTQTISSISHHSHPTITFSISVTSYSSSGSKYSTSPTVGRANTTHTISSTSPYTLTAITSSIFLGSNTTNPPPTTSYHTSESNYLTSSLTSNNTTQRSSPTSRYSHTSIIPSKASSNSTTHIPSTTSYRPSDSRDPTSLVVKRTNTAHSPSASTVMNTNTASSILITSHSSGIQTASLVSSGDNTIKTTASTSYHSQEPEYSSASITTGSSRQGSPHSSLKIMFPRYLLQKIATPIPCLQHMPVTIQNQ